MTLKGLTTSPQDTVHPAPWSRVLVSLGGGVVLATLVSAFWPLWWGQSFNAWIWLALQAASAAGIAAVVGLAWWWSLVCLLFLPALVLGLAVEFAPAWAAFCLAGLLLAYGGTQSTRVPLYLSSAAAITELGKLVCTNRPQRVLDLGCGTARVLSALSRAHPRVALEGVERAPLPFLIAWARHRLPGGSFGIHWQNLWTVDLSGYDMVYAYLSPAPMPRLWDKAKREMRRGSLLVSFEFCVPGVPPDRIVDAAGKKLFIWRMP
jgi:hypothetical protein